MTLNRHIKGRYKRIAILLALLALVALASIPLYRYNVFVFKKAAREIPEKYKVILVRYFPFSEENALREWEEKVFKGKVVYRIENSTSLSYVRATSKGTASALYYKVKLDAKKMHPVLGWKWNVRKFPAKKLPESLETKNEDDFAARVYVIFPAKFLLNSKVLEYIWTETLSDGMIGTSPYSKNIKLIVAHTGPNKDNQWFAEERDIIEDYNKAFGKAPEYNIGAIAFMTNTEHTGTSADSMYDEIILGYKEDAQAAKEVKK